MPVVSLAAAAALLLPQGKEPEAPPPMRPLPVPKVVCVPRGDARIAIDGTVVDWPSLPPLTLNDARQLSGTAMGVWRGPDDLSAQGFLMWDQDHLYVSFVVKDDWHRALQESTLQLTEIPVADSVVLTFDPDRDTRSLGPDPGRREDREFWLAQHGVHGKDLVQWDRLRGTARIVDDGTQFVSHNREAGITTYEARIPWSEILPTGRKPAPGLVFDLQVVVNDFDEITDPMPQTRIGWTFGSGPRIDPGLMGSVMLVEKAEPGSAMPEFPAPPNPSTEPVPGPRYWTDLQKSLAAAPPATYDGTDAPEQTGGLARMKVLERLDDHLESFPRVDFLEFHQRIHRRMQREVAGIVTRGLPYYWYSTLANISREAGAEPEAGTIRVYRLPMGGWLVRSPEASFAIDPAGPDIAYFLWGAMQFAILTHPLDMTRRNDQLLVRMAADKEPRVFLTHAAFHLPLIRMADLPLAAPGGDYGAPGGLRVKVIGSPLPDGSLPYSMSYLVTWPGPGSRSLLVLGPDAAASDLPEGLQPTVLLLSPRNPQAAALARRLRPGLAAIGDVFRCQTHAGVPRIGLEDAWKLQRELLPVPSVLLAPGEHLDAAGR